MSEKCSVYGCYAPTKVRGLCETHYAQHKHRRRDDDPTAVICDCERPDPDALGECDVCGRRVVTYVSETLRERYRRLWPEEWARAVTLGLGRKR